MDTRRRSRPFTAALLSALLAGTLIQRAAAVLSTPNPAVPRAAYPLWLIPALSAVIVFLLAVVAVLAVELRRARRSDRDREALQLKKQALEAIRNRQFRLFLQFIVREDGGIAGAEALSRWDHPQLGLLQPERYIAPLSRDARAIAALDLYVFEETCRQLECWQRQGRELSISCNFTRFTISHKTFIPQLEEIADQYVFDRSRLVIEITEDTMENDKETAFANAFRCKELGFRVALDDAGSGYTTFSDLRDYPIDIVKIDRSMLIAAVDQRGIDLLKGLITLVHGLQMKVLCEGVETADQAGLLRRLDCDYMQGHYFYRALPKEEADRLLKENDSHAEA